VLGGAVARSWDLIAEPLIRGLGPGPARLWQIRLAALPDTAGLIGAAWHATRDDDPVLCGTLPTSRSSGRRRSPD